MVDGGNGMNINPSLASKQRLRLTHELHERFVDAFAQLGGPDHGARGDRTRDGITYTPKLEGGTENISIRSYKLKITKITPLTNQIMFILKHHPQCTLESKFVI